MAVGAAEKKNLNCQKYATFEDVFMGKDKFSFFLNVVVKKLQNIS